MVQPQRSQRVVIALALAGRGADLRDAQFRKAYDRIAGEPEGIRFGLRGAFRVYLDIKPLRSAPKPRLPLLREGHRVQARLRGCRGGGLRHAGPEELLSARRHPLDAPVVEAAGQRGLDDLEVRRNVEVARRV